ncbi:MAG: glycosyltransferase family 9 protein [Acidobacteriota bacterium]
MQHILFTHTGTNVEFFLALPALQAVRRHFDRAQIWLAASDRACELAQLADCANTTLALGPALSTITRPSIFRAWRAFATLQEQSFDAVVSLTGAFLEKATTTLLRTRRRLVFQTGCTQPHLTEAVAALLARLGVPKTAPVPRLTLPPALLATEQQRLAKLGWRADRLTFALHPTVGFPPDVWPSEQFIPLAARLAAEYDAQLLVIETEEESGLTERQRAAWKQYRLKPLFLHRPSLGLLAVALAQASVVVGSNRLPVHLASAVQTPSVVILDGNSSWLAPRHRCSHLLYVQPTRPATVDDVFGLVCQAMAASRTAGLFTSDD